LAQEFSEQGAAYDPGARGGSGNVADTAFKAITNLANMATAKLAASSLVESAKNGGFTVTKESADELINTLAKFVDEIDAMKHDLMVFDQAPHLGNHDYGRRVAQFMHEAANGSNSARMVVLQLEEVLKMSIEALQRASGQYEETEANVVDSVKRAGRSA